MSINVVVGLIQKQSSVAGQGMSYLVAKRALDKHQGGLWEFPGGKVEDAELPDKALIRELQEELAITVTDYQHLLDFSYQYPDKSIDFIVYLIKGFDGQIRGNEKQAVRWVSKQDLQQLEFPAANKTIIDELLVLD